MELSRIRNFAIISHVDHGKSTLADRFLELTGTVPKEKLIPQMLDQNPIERERGITIKLQPVRMAYKLEAISYTLNLIDTPGHVDFSYEVSRSLAAVEGAILLVDATQGIQAETVAKAELAKAQGLSIIGAVNKIDLPVPDLNSRVQEVAELIGCNPEEIFMVSGKTGQGVEGLLRALITTVPPPTGKERGPLRALIFDSLYDPFKGVVAFVRVVDGAISQNDHLQLFHAKRSFEVLELGYFNPEMKPLGRLESGEIGYVATGIKEPDIVRVGDTIGAVPLLGYEEPQPLVFASVYPPSADLFPKLRQALERLRLNDAAMKFELEKYSSLGQGFRMGALGPLHLEIIEERLRREFGMTPLLASPSVAVEVQTKGGGAERVSSPEKLPLWHEIAQIREPWLALEVIAPSSFLGPLMRRLGALTHNNLAVETSSSQRLRITLEIPFRYLLEGLAEELKSVSSGFASFSYRVVGFRSSTLVRLDVAVAGVVEPSLSRLIPREETTSRGRALLLRLKELIPRELFAVALQAIVEGKVIARETIPALKKDVTGYLYGGDVTRKRKLWAKQKAGKKHLKERGRVRIPPEAFRRLVARNA